METDLIAIRSNHSHENHNDDSNTNADQIEIIKAEHQTKLKQKLEDGVNSNLTFTLLFYIFGDVHREDEINQAFIRLTYDNRNPSSAKLPIQKI